MSKHRADTFLHISELDGCAVYQIAGEKFREFIITVPDIQISKYRYRFSLSFFLVHHHRTAQRRGTAAYKVDTANRLVGM